jgi:hypothetical protein
LDLTKGPGGHLIAAFDNFPGQNKNNCVLKILCAWLIEKGFFSKVSAIFLVKGHTKNPCDHLFNALKRFYRAQNIETFKDLIDILNQSVDVATEVIPEDFHDWATMFKGLYTDFPIVLKYQHLFEFTDIEFVSMRVGDGHAEEVANLKFPKEEDDRLCAK